MLSGVLPVRVVQPSSTTWVLLGCAADCPARYYPPGANPVVPAASGDSSAAGAGPSSAIAEPAWDTQLIPLMGAAPPAQTLTMASGSSTAVPVSGTGTELSPERPMDLHVPAAKGVTMEHPSSFTGPVPPSAHAAEDSCTPARL